MSAQSPSNRVTIRELTERSRKGGRFTCLTAYDASMARVLDGCGIDVVLVGDSMGNVIQGHETTLPVTLDDMVYHTACVARGCRRALIMADMPFMSDADPHMALLSAARLMREGGAHIVKIEGGKPLAETISLLTKRGIPVCAHIGLKPQSVHKIGGYRVQGRDRASMDAILDDAWAVIEAGADMLLLECVTSELASEIVSAVKIPVIGIGAGPACQGHVLVLYDMLGITPGPHPRFYQNFLSEGGSIQGAVSAYVDAIMSKRYPSPEQAYQSAGSQDGD